MNTDRQTDDGSRALRSAVRVLAGGDGHQLSLAHGCRAAPGRMIERYAAVPSLVDPRALLPLDASPPALRAALRQHATGAGSRMARTAARMLYLASYVGLARPLLYSRVSVVTTSGELAELPMRGFLRKVLGREDFVTSLRLGPGRPNSKPVVQVVAPDGTVLAYAKFGWEDLTRRLLRREATVLRELALVTCGTALQIPRVLHAGEWHGFETLVLAPLEGTGRTPRSHAEVPVAASTALAGACPRSIERLRDSAFWGRTISRISQVVPLLPEGTRGLILRARRKVEASWGDVRLPMGRVHGDWIPPNMLVRHDGILNVWDWEWSVGDVPLGIDTVQFIVYIALRRRMPYRDLLGRLKRHGREALTRQCLDPENLTLLTILSLLETVLWFAEARLAGREETEDPRFTRALGIVLDQP
jgi:hypothetical protein